MWAGCNTRNKKTGVLPVIEKLPGSRLNDNVEQVKGKSGRQGRLTAPLLRSSILDCRFPGVLVSIHPDSNPFV